MCGLVFAGGRTSMSLGDVQLFEQFLQCDTYRGEHSTGVASLFKSYSSKEYNFRLAKAAVDGFDFVKTEYWDAVTKMRTTSAVGGAASYYTWPKVMFGHNRWATMGAVNAVNAHPFEVGHIILAHNGTLSSGWKSNMEDGHQFEVDSHCVAHNVAKIGIAATLQRIRGAFTLIWFNKEDLTLNIIRNDERPFHLWETSIGDWFGCSEEKMGDWLLTRGKISKTFRRHFECEPGTQYVFDVSDGCVLKEEIKHELPRFRYYHVQQTGTSTHGQGGYRSGYSNRDMLEQYDDNEAAMDEWWNERIRQRSSNGSVRRSETEEKGKTTTPSSSEVVTPFETSLRESGFPYKTRDIIEFEMFEYKEYPKKKGYGYIKGELPGSDEFIEVQVHDVKEGEFESGKRGGAMFVSGYEIHGVKTVIGRPQNDLTLYSLERCVKLIIEEVDDDQDFSFLDHLDDIDTPIEHRSMMSGERYNENQWKHSHHNVCAMCTDPIPFDEIEVATIENGYCFCGDCVKATDMRKHELVKERIKEHTFEPETIKISKTGEGFTRDTWNHRTHKDCCRCGFMLIFEDLPQLSLDDKGSVYCEDCADRMGIHSTVVQKEVYCLPCQGYHPSSVMKGEMTHAEWTALGVSCAWKIKYKDKFAPNPSRPILSLKKLDKEVGKNDWNYVCTACSLDFPGEMMSKEQEDLCSECYKRFHHSTDVRTSFTQEIGEKTLWNGMKVSEVMWNKMNKCRACVRKIPFAMADQVSNMGDAPVCPDCADELGV
ncbi:MAG: class II glutamine amidotransferase [Bacteroidales bacterium]